VKKIAHRHVAVIVAILPSALHHAKLASSLEAITRAVIVWKVVTLATMNSLVNLVMIPYALFVRPMRSVSSASTMPERLLLRWNKIRMRSASVSRGSLRSMGATLVGVLNTVFHALNRRNAISVTRATMSTGVRPVHRAQMGVRNATARERRVKLEVKGSRSGNISRHA
jgi:hypothetical protein